MNADTPLFARARLQMPNAAGYVRWLIEHLQQEGVQVVPGDSTDSLRLQMDNVGTLELQALADDALDCQIWPVDAPMLALVKMSLIDRGWSAPSTPPAFFERPPCRRRRQRPFP